MLQLHNNVCPQNKSRFINVRLRKALKKQCRVYLVQSSFPNIIRLLLKHYKYYDLPSAVTLCTRTNAKSHVFHIISFSWAWTVKLNQIIYQNRGTFCELGCISAALHLPVVADAAWHWPKANLPLFALSSAVSKDTRILKHPRDTANLCSQHVPDTIKPGETEKCQRKELAAFRHLSLNLQGEQLWSRSALVLKKEVRNFAFHSHASAKPLE